MSLTSLIRRAILSFVMIAGITPALAQAPPPVPALPDTERRTSYSISGTTCVCAVGFQLYGDSTDYVNWLEVFVNGVLIPQSGNWAITSPTGPLATIPRPITDAVLTFTAVQTGTVQIVGARRPRRTSQFQESQPVPTRNFNQTFSDIIATQRELWDKTNDFTGRAVLGRPGETLALLPVLASRQNMGACFDSGGNLTSCLSIPSTSFVAGNGISLTGVSPTTITNNIAAGNGVTITGTNPLTITNNIAAGASIAITGTNPLTIALSAPGVDTNTLRTVSSASPDTILNTDCGKTVQLGTGATGFFTETLPSVSGFAANCKVIITNADTTRAKGLLGFPIGFLPHLWMGQTAGVQIVNGAWAPYINPGRFRPTGNTFTLNVSHTSGTDAAGATDGLGTGASAFATIQNCGNIFYSEFDLAGGNTPKCLNAAELFTENNVFFQGQMTGRNVLQIAGAGMASTTWNCSAVIALGAKDNAEVQVDGFAFRNSGTCGPFIFEEGGGAIIDAAQNAPVDLGASAAAHIQVAAPGTVNINAPYTISGNAVAHIQYIGSGATVNVGGGTVTMPNALTMTTAFYVGVLSASLNSAAVTYTGAGSGAGTTGQKFALSYCATAALGGSTIPGASAGAATCVQAP